MIVIRRHWYIFIILTIFDSGLFCVWITNLEERRVEQFICAFVINSSLSWLFSRGVFLSILNACLIRKCFGESVVRCVAPACSDISGPAARTTWRRPFRCTSRARPLGRYTATVRSYPFYHGCLGSVCILSRDQIALIRTPETKLIIITRKNNIFTKNKPTSFLIQRRNDEKAV